MKKAAKTWYNYLLILAVSAIPAAVGLTCFFVIKNNEKWPLFYSALTMVFGGVVILGLGFIGQDIYRGVIRHKINDWDNPLDQKYLDKAWAIYFPLLFGGLLSFIAGGIMYLFVR